MKFFFFYHNKPNSGRTSKSLSCRMSCIMKAINKFRGCVRQVENLNQSGAFEIDIVSRYNTHFIKKNEYLF